MNLNKNIFVKLAFDALVIVFILSYQKIVQNIEKLENDIDIIRALVYNNIWLECMIMKYISARDAAQNRC